MIKAALNSLKFPGGSVGKESPCKAGDTGDSGAIPGLGGSPGGGLGYPLQYSWLKNPRGRWNLMGYSPYSHKDWAMTEATEHAQLLNSHYMLNS